MTDTIPKVRSKCLTGSIGSILVCFQKQILFWRGGGGVKQGALNVDVIYLPLSVRTSQEINTTHELSSPCYVARVNAS